MKLITLVNGRGVVKVDDEDYESLMAYRWQLFIIKAKNTVKHYAKRIEYIPGGKGKSRCILMHRVILGVTDPDLHVDHQNNDGLDCQRHNLRVATDSQNAQNRHILRSTKSSRFRGVSKTRRGKPWRASICLDRHRMYIGCFWEECDAALAYNLKAHELFGEFARLNEA